MMPAGSEGSYGDWMQVESVQQIRREALPPQMLDDALPDGSYVTPRGLANLGGQPFGVVATGARTMVVNVYLRNKENTVVCRLKPLAAVLTASSSCSCTMGSQRSITFAKLEIGRAPERERGAHTPSPLVEADHSDHSLGVRAVRNSMLNGLHFPPHSVLFSAAGALAASPTVVAAIRRGG